MAVRFILGRAGTGKTRRCVEEIVAALRESQTQPSQSPPTPPPTSTTSLLENPAESAAFPELIFLVPEQASLQCERLLAQHAPGRGYTRAAVLSFSQLCRRVFSEIGAEPEWLGPGPRRMVLHALLRRMQPELETLRFAATQPGFVRTLAGEIERWLSEGLSPEELMATTDAARAAGRAHAGLQRKAHELARIYRAYLDELGEARLDRAQRLAQLRTRLSAQRWLSHARVWVDGFAGFTAEEAETLATLAARARELTIALLLDPARSTGDALDLFSRTAQTRARLEERLARDGVTIAPPIALDDRFVARFRGVPQLARLERGLAGADDAPPRAPKRREDATPETASDDREAGAPPQTHPPIATEAFPSSQMRRAESAVRILTCPTHRDELVAAARYIRRRVGEAGGRLAFRDFAVVTRRLDPFAHLIGEVFDEYDIPYFLDRRRPLRGHPLGRLLLAALSALERGPSVETITPLLRCGLTPLARDAAERLEEVALERSARGWRDWLGPRWPAEPRASTAARQALLMPLHALATAQPATADGAAWSARLFGLLRAWGVDQRIAAWIDAAQRTGDWERAETHRLAWDTHMSVLEELQACLGMSPLCAHEVATLLDDALRERTLGLAPPKLDQVLISAIDRSRHPEIKYAWLFGFNEGLFPAPPADDALLSAAERRELAHAALTPRMDDLTGELMLAYVALTRASNGLVISYASAGLEGAPLEPSPLLADVRRALPEVEIETAAARPAPLTIEEAAANLLRLRDAASEALVERLRAQPEHAERLAFLLRGRNYTNRPAPLGNYRLPAGADERENAPARRCIWEGSVSEATRALRCPFQHFAHDGLRLREPVGFDQLRRELGDAAHAILAGATRRLVEHGGVVRTLSDAEAVACFEEAANAARQRLPADLAERMPRWAFFWQRQVELVRVVFHVHVARWRRSAYQPWRTEWPFGGSAAARRATRGTIDTLAADVSGAGTDHAGDDTPPRSLPEAPPGAALEAPLGGPALELNLDEDFIARIGGKIDRIDRAIVNGREHWLIYDYKPAARPLSKRGLLVIDEPLQLATYLAAAHASPEAERINLEGVFIAPLTSNESAYRRKDVAALSVLEQHMHAYVPRGWLGAGQYVLLVSQHGAGRSPVANVQLTKDGRPYQNCDVVAPERLTRLRAAGIAALTTAASVIAAGAIDISPLVIRGVRACQRCRFLDLCRVERGLNAARAAAGVIPEIHDTDADPTTGD